ncbi:MAG: hypothetical protein IAE82_15805 [Opitutaceae bacterium]|nr:hypothetical protein [Opitutaceae bacterium]
MTEPRACPRRSAGRQVLCALLAVALVAPLAAKESKEKRREKEGAAEPAKKPARPEIRSFDTETLSALGRQIYRHDSLAWIATDVLFAKVSQETVAAEGGAGWIVDTSGEAPVVRFVREVEERIEAAYDVVFPKEGKPHVVVPERRELSTAQLGAYRSYRTAIGALIERQSPWCGGTPNHVELPDPDGSGFLVYILRPKPAADVVPIGGHYRITVSADGGTVEQVDQLFASCLTLPRKAEGSDGKEIVALSMSHIDSPTPLETHVFLSLQEKLPFMLITEGGQMWSVEHGVITKAN